MRVIGEGYWEGCGGWGLRDNSDKRGVLVRWGVRIGFKG